MFFGAGGFPKEFWEMMEKMFLEKVNEAIRNPEFLSSASKVVGTGLESKKKMDEAAREYLERMHLPTREDFAHGMQYLQQVEARLIALEEKIDDYFDELKGGKPEAKILVKARKKPAAIKTVKTVQAPKTSKAVKATGRAKK